jgi:hypothetical protein
MNVLAVQFTPSIYSQKKNSTAFRVLLHAFRDLGFKSATATRIEIRT